MFAFGVYSLKSFGLMVLKISILVFVGTVTLYDNGNLTAIVIKYLAASILLDVWFNLRTRHEKASADLLEKTKRGYDEFNDGNYSAMEQHPTFDTSGYWLDEDDNLVPPVKKKRR